jgi:cell shape-determining protein MreD
VTAKIIRWAGVMLSVVAYQGLLAEYLAPGGAGLRWDLLVVLIAGLTGGVTRGILAGGIVGFITDCLTPSYLGWGVMINATLGGMIGICRERLFLEHLYSRWIVLAAGIAIHDIIYLLPFTGFNMGLYIQTLWRDTGFSVVVTSLVGTLALVVWQTAHRSARPARVEAPEKTSPT